MLFYERIDEGLLGLKAGYLVEGIGDKRSSWATVLSGVPQLFVLFINDTDDWTLSKIFEFAGDTKLFRSVGGWT